MAESQQLVLIQHHFLQKKLFSQKPGARFKSRVFKTQILSPHMYTWLTPAVFSFKMLVIQADSEILSVPCRLLILSGNHHVLYMKSNPDHLDYLYSFSNDLVAQDDQTIVHNHAFKKKPLGFKDHRACAIFDHI